ncbi:TIGR03364 family FAD-dependent oxidoreductase [Methylopila sp. 73B]|uniref:TIGR03364 family FAD-dependent oxidoreductase n=1 Tax=Methylopila sp. 73B TaxID=1120792 RepID=UPI00035DB30F|nr:TIGR03364 family FAD-dependent oxidoreductase [Methylopila sp. 73B]
MPDTFDLAVVGGGVLGLAHALAAARSGRRVVVVDREGRANGASVRMPGIVGVTGQPAGGAWRRAKRSRDVWADVAAQASVRIEHEGLAIVARRPEAASALEAFMATEMGEDCTLYAAEDGHALFPQFKGAMSAVFWSPHELRVEAKSAMPKIAAWLAEAHDVAFRWETAVTAVEGTRLTTSRGAIEAEAIVVCPGDDFRSLFGETLARAGLVRAKSHMLRVRPEEGFELPGAVATDLSLIRLPGFAELPEASALRARLEAEQPEHLAHGVALIATQSADDTLVLGASRQVDATPDPFQTQAIDELILEEFAAVFGKRPKAVLSRWTGTYAFNPERPVVVEAPAPNVRVVVAASGAGATGAFAIGEETIADLFGKG